MVLRLLASSATLIYNSRTRLKYEAENEDEIGVNFHGSEDVIVLIHLIILAV